MKESLFCFVTLMFWACPCCFAICDWVLLRSGLFWLLFKTEFMRSVVFAFVWFWFYERERIDSCGEKWDQWEYYAKTQQYFVIFSYTTTITYLLCTNKVLNVPRKRGRMISKVRRLLWCPWALCLLLWYLHFPFLPNQTYEYRNHCRWWRFDEFF